MAGLCLPGTPLPMLDVWREVLREKIPHEEILYKTSVMCGVLIFFFSFYLKYNGQKIPTTAPKGISLTGKALCLISCPYSSLKNITIIAIGGQEII